MRIRTLFSRSLKNSLAALLLFASVAGRPVHSQKCAPCKDVRTGKLLANGAPKVTLTTKIAAADPYRRKASAEALKWADSELKKIYEG